MFSNEGEGCLAAGDADQSDHVLSFEAGLDKYEREVTPLKKGIREEKSTLRTIRRHGAWLLNRPLSDIRTRDIAAYRDLRRRTPCVRVLRNGREIPTKPPCGTTIRKELNLISDLYSKARIEWGLDDLQNPVAPRIRPRANRGRIRRIADEERHHLMQECRAYQASPVSSVPIADIVDFALESAMRLGEIAELRWEYVDFSRSTALLLDTKNGDDRNVPLSPRALEILQRRRRFESGRVWGTKKESIRRAWNRVIDKAGLKGLRFHDLRHEAISRMVEESNRTGMSTPEIMFVSGHRTLSMMSRYFHAQAPLIAKKLSQRD
jgi:integrase